MKCFVKIIPRIHEMPRIHGFRPCTTLLVIWYHVLLTCPELENRILLSFLRQLNIGALRIIIDGVVDLQKYPQISLCENSQMCKPVTLQHEGISGQIFLVYMRERKIICFSSYLKGWWTEKNQKKSMLGCTTKVWLPCKNKTLETQCQQAQLLEFVFVHAYHASN